MRLSNEEAHRKIRDLFQRAAAERGLTAIIVTDGAGHEDGYAGCGWSTIAIPKGRAGSGCAAETDSSTARGEFNALLGGIRQVLRALDLTKASRLEDYRYNRLVIQWTTDREDLALSVWKNPDTGETHNRRKTERDLWSAFEHYEKYLEVFPMWAPRNSDPQMKLVDRLASESRILLKQYFEATKCLPPSES